MTHIAYSTPATYPHVAALDPTPWMASALCAQVEPDLFYPDRSADTREAKKVCGQCEVCLLYTSPSPRDKRQSRMPSSA